MEPNLTTLTRVEKITGAKPTSWRHIDRGYTVAERWVMSLDNGGSVFVKVATNDNTTGWLRDEAKVYQSIRGDFLPKFIGWDDGEFPLLILEDLSAGTWSWEWSQEYIQRVLNTLDKVANTQLPQDFPELTRMSEKLTGWREVAEDPSGFLELGLVSADWLQRALPTLIQAESAVKLEGNSLVHFDVRSDNICFYGDRMLLIDWNWAMRGNPKVDLISWLPSLHAEGGPPPWEITLDEPELIAATAGYYAAHAPRPIHKQGEAVRQLHLRLLKSALPWATRALNLPQL